MKDYQCDVVVVGSGTGGGGTAYFCAAAGLKTILVEADDGFGAAIAGAEPNSAMLTGVNGVFAVESRYQNSKHIRTTKKDVFQYLMEHANWSVPAWQAAALAGRSAAIWNWLEDQGCASEQAVAYNWTSPHTWLYFDDTKPRLEVVGKAFLDAGGTLFSCALFDEIIIENGRAAGVRGKMDETGEPFEVKAKAVVLAFGEPKSEGDMGPMPMMGKVVEKPDGFKAAEAVGCVRMEETRSAMCQLAKPAGIGGPGDPNEPQEAYIRQPESLAVNTDGERFTTEEILGTMEDGACSIGIQKEGTAFILFDDNINQHWIERGFTSTKYRYGNEGPAYKNLESVLNASIAAGFSPCIFVGDSIRELAEKMGVDVSSLTKTVEEYNRCCACGEDPYFFKDQKYLIPLKGPKYYAMKCRSGINVLPGVLKTDSKLRLLDTNNMPIPGLYGAGGCISFLNGRIYTHHVAGSRSMFGLVCGQLLGEIIPEYINGI